MIASRVTGAARTLIVERGSWWRPGSFPESFVGLARACVTGRKERGLWGVRLGAGTGNAFATAVGGSSVLNYGITETPDPHSLAGWPIQFSELDRYFARARAVLGASASPRAIELGDRQFFDRVAPGRRHDLSNAIDWARCDDCGRCVPGCNTGAKKSLDLTYLGHALAKGASLRCDTTVRQIVPRAGGYRLVVSPTGGGPTDYIDTRRVVLAAGTFGTLDLLHASREELPLSPAFGQRIGMNGDAMAFLYDVADRLDSHSGAPISTSVRLPFVGRDGMTKTLMVMSGRIPMMAMRFAAGALSVGADLLRDRAVPAGRRNLGGRLRDLLGPRAGGALSRTLMYKLDGQDEARGTIRHTEAGAVVDWPDYLDDPVHAFARQTLHEWAAKTGGTALVDVATLPGMRSFGVHALGGCRMATSVQGGVVDSFGRVFDPVRGATYDGLRIADGSIFPGSLGVPPSLTIAALAERVAESLLGELEDERWTGLATGSN